jgi:hypothetical protein
VGSKPVRQSGTDNVDIVELQIHPLTATTPFGGAGALRQSHSAPPVAVERPWRPSLEPWDFAPFLLEKRNHFTGRKWLFRELDKWRHREAPPALLITGEPGDREVGLRGRHGAREPGRRGLAYHCRADRRPVKTWGSGGDIRRY